MNKSKWQEEFDSLPEWAQKMARAIQQCVAHGSFSPKNMGLPFDGVGFHIIYRDDAAEREWCDGFSGLLGLAQALTAPWPPPAPPVRERRAVNLVELIADDSDGGGFDQPCAFGNRVGYHAVYCHNDTWPNRPRKCRRGEACAQIYGIPEKENRHADCPGFVPNPDYHP